MATQSQCMNHSLLTEPQWSLVTDLAVQWGGERGVGGGRVDREGGWSAQVGVGVGFGAAIPGRIGPLQSGSAAE